MYTRILGKQEFIKIFCLLNCALGTYEQYLTIPVGGVRPVLFGKGNHLLTEGIRYLKTFDEESTKLLIEKGNSYAKKEIRERLIEVATTKGKKLDPVGVARKVYEQVMKENDFTVSFFLALKLKDYHRYEHPQSGLKELALDRCVDWLTSKL